MKDAAPGSKAPGTGTRRSRQLAFWTIAGLARRAGWRLCPDARPPRPTTADDSGALQEVVVTAERRSENVQTVPIAITAFTNDTLQQRNLTDIQVLGDLTPGVKLDAGCPVLR